MSSANNKPPTSYVGLIKHTTLQNEVFYEGVCVCFLKQSASYLAAGLDERINLPNQKRGHSYAI